MRFELVKENGNLEGLQPENEIANNVKAQILCMNAYSVYCVHYADILASKEFFSYCGEVR
jgi:hypothetical protein